VVQPEPFEFALHAFDVGCSRLAVELFMFTPACGRTASWSSAFVTDDSTVAARNRSVLCAEDSVLQYRFPITVTEALAHLLDNIFWNCLNGPHAGLSTGTAQARRYAPGFSPIVGFPDPQQPDFAALAPFCEAGEQFYCGGWSGLAPDGWQVVAEATMFRMVWDGQPPAFDPAADAVPLEARHAAQALELATLTRPGPFGLRTIELGEYFGYFDGERLVAMAGERMAAAGLREISGVCTHPDYLGRGYARRLMEKLVLRELGRGETPFLHVMSNNERAHTLYLRMGFRDYCETAVRVVARS
jgi:GNAT superfamily N-acetyltransferase